jgi:hypothetical protein
LLLFSLFFFLFLKQPLTQPTGCINSVSAFLLYVFPKWSLEQLGVTPTPELELMMAWFGSLVAILGYIGLRSEVSVENIEGLLLGDILWLFVGVHFLNHYASHYTPSGYFSVGITMFLAFARTLYVVRHYFAARDLEIKKPATAQKKKASPRAKSPRRGRSRSRK